MYTILWASFFSYKLCETSLFPTDALFHAFANIVWGLMFVCFEALHYFDSDDNGMSSGFRPFGTACLQQTIDDHFEKIRPITKVENVIQQSLDSQEHKTSKNDFRNVSIKKFRAGVFVTFIVVNVILACYHIVMHYFFFCWCYLGIIALHSDVVFIVRLQRKEANIGATLNKEYAFLRKD